MMFSSRKLSTYSGGGAFDIYTVLQKHFLAAGLPSFCLCELTTPMKVSALVIVLCSNTEASILELAAALCA